MFEALDSPFRVPFDGSFVCAEAPTAPPAEAPDKKHCKRRLAELVDELDELQRVLYASSRYAVLLVFQAMDSAGKDSTIRAVMRGVDPSGCRVTSFKKPSAEELAHDFLWRTVKQLPRRGEIGIFNRSYYEEVLIARVHPELLAGQGVARDVGVEALWQERYESIRDHEKHLARNNTIILKFWLNVSREEQRRRFLSRIDEPQKHWKFEEADVQERRYWREYMLAYEDALNATARPWAPWYAIPADNKPYMRLCVAEILVNTLRNLKLDYPSVSAERREQFAHMRRLLDVDG